MTELQIILLVWGFLIGVGLVYITIWLEEVMGLRAVNLDRNPASVPLVGAWLAASFAVLIWGAIDSSSNSGPAGVSIFALVAIIIALVMRLGENK